MYQVSAWYIKHCAWFERIGGYMYEKCIDCDRLGKDCIPNLYIMTSDEIRDWARKRKEFLGWSNADLSEKSGVPKGTIDSNFSKNPDKNADVNNDGQILIDDAVGTVNIIMNEQ